MDEDEGYEKCEMCDGFGFFMEESSSPVPNHWFCLCRKCGGFGKIDWVQKMIQKDFPAKPVFSIIEGLYFSMTGRFVLDQGDQFKMLAYFYDKCKVYKRK